MTTFIKYSRISREFDNKEEIQKFFDELIIDGWEIIHYEETPKSVTDLNIIVVVGRRNPIL